MSDFDKAAEEAKQFKSLSNDDMLALYGLYKQATVGNVNTDRPGMFDPKGKAKWDAWKACEGKSNDDAKAAYASKVKELKDAGKK